MRHYILKIGKEAVFNVNVFTQNFFTENATLIQNCTSFYSNGFITYLHINGKLFLYLDGYLAQYRISDG